MKTKRFLAIFMVIAISMSLFVMPTSAAEEKECHDHIEVYFEDENLSPEFKEKATAYFLNGGADNEDNAATYGLTCTLLGHKLETSSTYTITHKARATSPRCLKKIYNYSTCTRCEYQESTLVSSSYIVCCA